MLYTQSDKETKSEGKAIRVISLRLSSDLLQKLNETLDKMGIGALKNGDDRSEKLRKYIEVTHERLVIANPVTVTTHKPKSERHCYQLGTWVTTSFCEQCRAKSPQVYLNCPEVLKEQRK